MASDERTLTTKEQAALQDYLSRLPTSSMRFRRGLGNALVLCAATLLVFVVAWWVAAWLAMKVTRVDFGWKSPWALQILAVGTAVSCVYAALSTLRWMRSWPDPRPLVLRDLAGRVTTEESLVLTAAKRFQEPEHGGLIYFLQTSDDRVFVLYDHESQNLGVQSKNPLNSGFQPRVQLRIVRVPASRYVLNTTFSGAALKLEDPLDLTAPPKQWPETEEFCEISWDKLEGRLSNGKRSAWSAEPS